MRRLRRLVLILACVAAGCAGPGPTGSPGTSPAPADTPLPTIDARGLISASLSCGEGAPFPVAALNGPDGAELGADPVAAGLRAVLAEGGDPQLPRSGWHLVSLSLTHATFVARATNDSGWAVVALDNGQAGWTADTVGECRLQFVLGPGLGRARWWLDPAAGLPPPEATSFIALVHQECGRSTEGRIVAPIIVYDPAAVIVVFAVTPVPGQGDADTICLDSPASPYRVVLSEPLGDRRLLDGSVIPPRDPVEPTT